MIVLESFDYLSLTVKDITKSKEFYQELLDFEIAREFEQETAVILELKGTRIKLTENSDFSGVESNNSIFMCFEMDVDDFTDALIELEEREIILDSGPAAEEGGEAVYIKDPDGYRVKLAYRE